MKPTGLCPAAINSSFNKLTIAATNGLLALVPSTLVCCPSTKIWKFVPCALRSGNARPEELNSPSLVLPLAVRKVETASAW